MGTGAPLGSALAWALPTWSSWEEPQADGFVGLPGVPCPAKVSLYQVPTVYPTGPQGLGVDHCGLCQDLVNSECTCGSLHLGQGVPGGGACLVSVPPGRVLHS